MILMLDNHDSFTYNLVDYLSQLRQTVHVIQSDAVCLDDIHRAQPDGIVLSPGPGDPPQAGQSLAVIEAFKGKIPLLGVCLGHQCIAAHFGAPIVRAPRILHGQTSHVRHEQQGLFAGLPNGFRIARYHSLVADERNWPDELMIHARDQEDGSIMGIAHRHWPIWGIQFHPEAILSEHGLALLSRFIDLSKNHAAAGF